MSPVPIVPQSIAHVPLDPFSIAVFALAFIVAAAVTRLRPAGGIALVLICDPFAYYRYLGETTVTLPKVVLLGVLAGLILRRVSLRPLGDRRIRPISIAAGAVVAATALSLLDARYRGESVREILKALEYGLLFAAMLLAATVDPEEWVVQRALGLATLLVIALAIAQEYTTAPAALAFGGQILPRIGGPLEGPNQLAGWLEIALPVLLAFRLTQGGSIFDDLLLVAGAFAELLTFSRAGVAGLAIGALTVVVAVRLRERARLFVAGAMLCIALLAVGAGAFVIGGHGGGALAEAPLIGHAGDAIAAGPDPSLHVQTALGTRTELWRAAWAMWRAHPLLGAGAGNYELEIAQYGPAGVRTHANSLYLQSLAEGGIVLLLSYAGLLIATLVIFAASARTALVAGVLGATLALGAHQIFDYLFFFPKVGDLWWALLGLGAASVRAFAVNDGGNRT